MRGTRRTPLKFVLQVLALTGVLAAVGITILILVLPTMIKTVVETKGARVLGVPVMLEDVDLSLQSGGIIQAALTQLTIGNPEGYETAHAFSLPHVRVRVDGLSLLSDTIIVEDVLIEGPRVTLERLKMSSNLSDIQRNITRGASSDSDDADDDREEEGDEDEESEPRVHIRTVTLQDAELNVSLMGGNRGVVQLPLPDLELRDIGAPSDGDGLRESSARIFKSVHAAIMDAVTQSGTLLPRGVEQFGKAAESLRKELRQDVEQAGEELEKAGKALLKGLFKRE